jgi:hypothetical protein
VPINLTHRGTHSVEHSLAVPVGEKRRPRRRAAPPFMQAAIIYRHATIEADARIAASLD